MSEANETHSLRIFTIISQIEQLLENAPRPKLGGGAKRLVDITEVFDLLGDLKVTIPENIRKANSILLEADTLLEHANQDAVDIVDAAQKEANAISKKAQADLAQSRQMAEEEFENRVSEDSIIAEVNRRCELLRQHAQHNANEVYEGAKQYADAVLAHLQNYLIENFNRVGQNRDELGVIAPMPPQTQQYSEKAPPPQQRAADASAYASAEVQYDQEEEQEWQAPRKKRGILKRNTDDDFFDEVEEEKAKATLFENDQPAKRRSRRAARKQEDLDLDLEE